MSPGGARAVMRGDLSALRADRGTLGLVAALTLLFAVIATAASAVDFAMLFMLGYLLVPLLTTGVAAVLVSGDRASGYASVLHTAPVAARGYLAAKLGVGVTWTLLAVLLGVPFGVLLGLHAGAGFFAEALLPWLLVAAVMALYSASLGVLISVAAGRRGLLPSVFLGLGGALGMALVPTLLRALPPSMAEAADGLAHLSPLVLLGDAQVEALFDPSAWAYWRAILLLAWFAAVFAATAFLVYTRLQNPEGWDAPAWKGAAVLVAGLAIAATPVLVMDFEGPAPPVFQGGQRLEIGALAVQTTGSDPAAVPVQRGEAREVELRLAYHGRGDGEPRTVHDVRIELQGSRGMEVSPGVVEVGDVELVPCRGAPPEARCLAAPDAIYPVHVRVTGARSLGMTHGQVQMQVVSPDQPAGAGFNGFLVTIAPAQGYAWWHHFALAGLIVGLVALPQLRRGRTLGRRAAFTPVRPSRQR